MAETFVILLTAHLLGDFVLQGDWIIQRKKRFRVLALHAGLVTAASALLLGSLHAPILLIIFGSHFVIDAIKVRWLPDRAGTFIADQLMHVGVVGALAIGFREAARAGLWMTKLPEGTQTCYLVAVTFLGGFLLCVPAGGTLIGKLTVPLAEQIDADIEGLRHGGRYIGWLERSLVMMLLFIHQPAGIGFLVAAKSILRFGEIKDSSHRRVAEYIIIGTFLSFGWGLLIAVLTQQAMMLW